MFLILFPLHSALKLNQPVKRILWIQTFRNETLTTDIFLWSSIVLDTALLVIFPSLVDALFSVMSAAFKMKNIWPTSLVLNLHGTRQKKKKRKKTNYMDHLFTLHVISLR